MYCVCVKFQEGRPAQVGETGSTVVEESQTLYDEVEFTEVLFPYLLRFCSSSLFMIGLCWCLSLWWWLSLQRGYVCVLRSKLTDIVMSFLTDASFLLLLLLFFFKPFVLLI